jgi:hypothetical protein
LTISCDSHRTRRSRIVTAFLHDQTITQDVYVEELAAATADIADIKAEISRIHDQDLDIDRLFNASAWMLGNASRLWVNADLEGRQRLQQALFPDGLQYSRDRGFWNPATAKAFNIIGTLKADRSKLAGGQGFEPR